jgi:hypothetical protein
MDKSNGRRPTRSMRSQGMKLATKNQVCRKPAMRPERCLSKPMDLLKRVPL